ncbi:uncharacterized protein LOC118467180 [Anopheles albimanus]|nr:uncharacterized protein LOC118467180 [Anopheles albimanus]
MEENCIAECVLGDALVDGQFQMNASITLLTNQTGDDSLLTGQITSAIHKCYKIIYLNLKSMTLSSDSCMASARRFLDCIFAIIYRNCPKPYWKESEECRRMVYTLNNCPNFLVQSRIF